MSAQTVRHGTGRAPGELRAMAVKKRKLQAVMAEFGRRRARPTRIQPGTRRDGPGLAVASTAGGWPGAMSRMARLRRTSG
jgi:hypothetical protein